jgi:dolichol-phosphate mannosyltransferase
MKKLPFIAVVIPCYKVRNHISKVINKIDKRVNRIYIVDDFCPEQTGRYLKRSLKDSRLRILFHKSNCGVGAAVMTGYKEALKDNAQVIIKIDGDGQMDPTLMWNFINPIIEGKADYTKGNRFYDLEEILAMPTVRIIGNTVLSFMNKVSSGYWNIFDPTNGYTAIHSDVLKLLPLKKISNRYFFESDMLFRLNTLKAVVVDVPMNAKYGKESSNLNIRSILFEFFMKHLKNTFKRIFYNYYLRDLSVASFELPLGICFLLFGLIFGVQRWIHFAELGVAAGSGTVMLSAIPLLISVQFILAFINYDINSIPKTIRHK